MSDFGPGWPPLDREMTAVDYLWEAAILLDAVEPAVSAGLRALSQRLREEWARNSAIRDALVRINGGPIPDAGT